MHLEAITSKQKQILDKLKSLLSFSENFKIKKLQEH